jgi:hypothetical protein
MLLGPYLATVDQPHAPRRPQHKTSPCKSTIHTVTQASLAPLNLLIPKHHHGATLSNTKVVSISHMVDLPGAQPQNFAFM